MFRHDTSIAPASYDEYVKMHSDEIERCLLGVLEEFRNDHESCCEWALSELGMRLGSIDSIPPYKYMYERGKEVVSFSDNLYNSYYATNWDEFGFQVYFDLFGNDPDLVEKIASDMAWALDYKLAMNFIKTQDGTPLAGIVSELYEYDYSEPQWRTKYDADKDYVISVIEDELVGSHLVKCYFEWCCIFYNGYDEDVLTWAGYAGFEYPNYWVIDINGSETDYLAKHAAAEEYMKEVWERLDFDVLPKPWLLDAIRKNRVESREDFHF